jgi:predicted Zn-dependent protease
MPRPTALATAVILASVACTSAASAQTRLPTSSGFEKLAVSADAARDDGRLDEAVKLYRRALALRATWKEGWWSLGTILYDQDSYDTAARAFRHLISNDPKNGTAHLMLALCEYQLSDDDSALRNIRAAKQLGISKDERLVRVLQYHEAMLLLRAGRYEDGIEVLQPLVADGVDSQDLDTSLGLGVLLIRPNDAPPEGSPGHEILMRAGRAERYRLAKQFEDARRSYGALIGEFPSFPSLHYAYGRFLLSVNDSDAAIAQFLEEIKNNPQHVRARVQIAAARYRVDSPAAIPFAEEVVRLQPEYPFGHYLLGLLYLDTQDISRSIRELEAAVRMVPREPQFHFALGRAYARAGRAQEAARARAEFLRLGGGKASSSGTAPEVDERLLNLERPRKPRANP